MASAGKVVVIGGGPSGLMAAGQAAENGATVVLLEKMKTPARKLRITGKGRCNLTNIAEQRDFLAHLGRSGRFLNQAFNRFFSEDLIGFFESLGLEVVVERGGRVFPAYQDAPAVAKLLVDWNQNRGVRIKTGSVVEQLMMSNGIINGVVCNGRRIEADKVIVATGGKSYPRTGSTGDGYQLAASVGHSIIGVRLALVPLLAGSGEFSELAGLTLRNVKARLYLNNKRIKDAFGELSFTASGLSGPIILTISSLVVQALDDKDRVVINIDLKPAVDEQKLEARLLRDLDQRGQEPMSSLLRGLLPKPLVGFCLQETAIDPGLQGNRLRADERKKLRYWLKNLTIEISGYSSFDEAIITSGGVNTREIDPRTMESKLVKGLYLIGELLDIQADTGGYNLQAAFSTGWLAGRSAAL